MWPLPACPDTPLLDRGYIHDQHALALDALRNYHCRSGRSVIAAFDFTGSKWLFRTKSGGEPSPVFESATTLLVWMKVEGWPNGTS